VLTESVKDQCTILFLQVFQQRYDGSVDFYRDWLTDEKGFGCLGRELWLGTLCYIKQFR
jgi:hypothetical protein